MKFIMSLFICLFWVYKFLKRMWESKYKNIYSMVNKIGVESKF